MVEEVFKALDQLRKEMSIFIIEHNLDLVLALADRAYVLDRGRVSIKVPQRRCSPISSCAAGCCGCERVERIAAMYRRTALSENPSCGRWM